MIKSIILRMLILILISIATLAFASGALVITDYHRTFIPAYDKEGHLFIAIRMYYIDGQPYFLVVNPYTFATQSAPAINFKYRKLPPKGNRKYYSMTEVETTPYMQALLKYTSPPYPLQNYGITHAELPVKGEILTVDMCPSSKTFEEEFFKTLVTAAERTQQSIPLAISISGLWMIDHPEELKWLIDQENTNKLKITWINHSFSHVYYRDLPLKDNFLLTPQTNIKHEILETEKILLKNQQLPSVFFRFPGLISDKKWILTLRQYGLIPVGSNAWLAKGEQAKNGSIILVHGNSNEPLGIKIIIPLLQQNKLILLPLNQAFKGK